MFEGVVAEPEWLHGYHAPDEALDDPRDPDAMLEQLLADSERGVAEGWLPPFPLPDEPLSDALVDLDERVPGYGNCEPSGWLALDLDSRTADPSSLDDHTLVEAMVGFERLAAWASARQARLLDALAARRPTDRAPYSARWACVGSEYAPDEVGVALHLSRGTACARIGLARRLLSVLPDTHALWEAGLIDTAKARAVDDATVVLSDELARAVEARVLPRAPQQTLAELKAALARAVIAVDPDGAEQRHKAARRDRRVVVTPEADGMATLWAMLTASQAVGAFTWLTRLARGLGPDDPRSMDTRRADILAALLAGRMVLAADTAPTTDESGADGSAESSGDAGGTGSDAGPGRPIQPVTPGKPLIQVVIPYSTLTGADDQPAELAGYGPIPASLAREVAADGIWRRLVTDPLSGTLLDHGRTTYHPPAALADFVRARDVYCRRPGCRRRAADAELDHITPWSAGGTTSEDNLAGYCTHDHRLKTYAGWHVRAHPDGSLTWTTPTGHRHTTRPHDYGPEPPGPPPVPRPKPTGPDDPGGDPPPF